MSGRRIVGVAPHLKKLPTVIKNKDAQSVFLTGCASFVILIANVSSFSPFQPGHHGLLEQLPAAQAPILQGGVHPLPQFPAHGQLPGLGGRAGIFLEKILPPGAPLHFYAPLSFQSVTSSPSTTHGPRAVFLSPRFLSFCRGPAHRVPMVAIGVDDQPILLGFGAAPISRGTAPQNSETPT